MPEADAVAILTIEDEEAVQFFLTEALSYAGYRVTSASNAEEALRCLSVGAFALAVVDLGLPGLSGLDLLPILRARWPDMVPIVLSAHDDRDTAIEALQAGAYDFLSKPCTTAELREAVGLALDGRIRREHRKRMLALLSHDVQATVAAARQAAFVEIEETP